MIKSHTKNASVLKEMTKYGFDRISEWTKKELAELQALSKEPICLELSNGDYIVATYKVIKLGTGLGWGIDDLLFTTKESAIFYASLMHLGKLEEARTLLAADARVAMLDEQKNFFRIRADQAHEQQDEFKIGLYSSRYTEVKNNLVSAKKELTKIINNAKYINALGKDYYEITRPAK